MREQPRWRRYVRFWGPDVEADIDDEIRFHLEMRERDFLAEGLSPSAAREEALARFGDPEKVRRWLREHDTRRQRRDRRSEILSDLRQDARYGIRRLWQSPGFTIAVVLVLALGIGATTAIFSVLYAALLRPLPYPEPERLVTVRDFQGQDEIPASYPEYRDWKGATDIFSEVAAGFSTTLTLTGAGEPESLTAIQMSASLPKMLGVVPRVGRAFAPKEDERSAPAVVMLSDALWRRRFGGDPGVLGRSIMLHGNPCTVIGIIPAGQSSIVPHDLAAAREVDIWIPLWLDDEVAPRKFHFLYVIGQLRPGLTFSQAEPRVEALARRLQETGITEHGIRLGTLEQLVIGDSRPLLVSLAGAVGMVLLIACTNIANLLLARSAVRRGEVAIRLALGAQRGRIVRQLLVESLLLALLGGAAGALVARAGVAGLHSLGPVGLPRLDEATVDTRMLAFTFVLSLFTGLLFGLLPAILASRGDLSLVMKTGARGVVGPARHRLRGALIVAEVALSFALLIGAGLLIRSLNRLLEVDKGFDADRVLTARVVLPYSRYPEAHQQAAFFSELHERLETLPGGRGAAYVSSLPLRGNANGEIAIEGRTFPPDAPPIVDKKIASPGYFEVLHTPLLAGRTFNARDRKGAPPVVVVNQAFVRRYFPGQSPLGKRLEFDWDTTGLQEIVGVVGDAREQALSEPARPTVFIPLAQRPAADMYVVLRTEEEPMSIVPKLRAAVYALDRNQPIEDVSALGDIVDQGLAGRRLTLSLFGAFSALALVLAAVGLYAVVSYSVQQKRQEIGIRMALGALASQITRAVVGQGMTLIAVGTAAGALAALWLGRFLSSLVFGVGTTDPATFAGVAFLLLATALLASLLPALRATRVDPASVLRSE